MAGTIPSAPDHSHRWSQILLTTLCYLFSNTREETCKKAKRLINGHFASLLINIHTYKAVRDTHLHGRPLHIENNLFQVRTAMELRPLTSIPKKTENRKQWCSEKCFWICISSIMFTVFILALTWSLSLSLLFGGDSKLIFTHKRSLPLKGPTDVLQQPWISRNVWYQLAKYSVKSVSNHSCVVSMKDAVPITYTGVPGEMDPLYCTSYALCSMVLIMRSCTCLSMLLG